MICPPSPVPALRSPLRAPSCLATQGSGIYFLRRGSLFGPDPDDGHGTLRREVAAKVLNRICSSAAFQAQPYRLKWRHAMKKQPHAGTPSLVWFAAAFILFECLLYFVPMPTQGCYRPAFRISKSIAGTNGSKVITHRNSRASEAADMDILGGRRKQTVRRCHTGCTGRLHPPRGRQRSRFSSNRERGDPVAQRLRPRHVVLSWHMAPERPDCVRKADRPARADRPDAAQRRRYLKSEAAAVCASHARAGCHYSQTLTRAHTNWWAAC